MEVVYLSRTEMTELVREKLKLFNDTKSNPKNGIVHIADGKIYRVRT